MGTSTREKVLAHPVEESCPHTRVWTALGLLRGPRVCWRLRPPGSERGAPWRLHENRRGRGRLAVCISDPGLPLLGLLASVLLALLLADLPR